MAKDKVTLYRAPTDVSPKVVVPSTVTLVVAVLWALVNGVVDPEQISLAVAAVVQFVIGYLKPDVIEA